jgi:putative superfamily III holin-X
MTVTEPEAHPVHRDEPDDQPLGAVAKEVSGDFSRLVQEQLALAKLEMSQEAGKAAAGAGMLGAAGFAGYMVLIFGSLTAVFGIGHFLGLGWGALIVTGAWALFALVMALTGRAVLKRLTGPQQTIAALKENLAWLRTLKK